MVIRLLRATFSPVLSGTAIAHGELIRRVAERDVGSFKALHSHYAPRIKGYLVRRGANNDLAEEVVQETLLKVWHRAESFDPTRSAVSTWIYTIARNAFIDRVRRHGRAAPDPNDPAWVPEDIAPAPDDHVARTQQTKRLSEALRQLPEEQVAVIQGTYFRGQSLAELAGELGLPLGTVKTRARLAMNRLRKAMHGEEAPTS